VPLSTVPLTAVSSGVLTTSFASVKLSSTGVTVIVTPDTVPTDQGNVPAGTTVDVQLLEGLI
jgi:hypothetical protein